MFQIWLVWKVSVLYCIFLAKQTLAERFMKLLAHILPNSLLIDLVLLQYESFLFFLNEESLSILALLLNLLFQRVMGLHLLPYLSSKRSVMLFTVRILGSRG